MPHKKKLQPGEGATATCLLHFLHPQHLLQPTTSTTSTPPPKKKKLTNLKLIRAQHKTIRKYSPPTWAILCTHADYPNVELYAAAGNIVVTEEGPPDRFFDFGIVGGASVKMEEGRKRRGGAAALSSSHKPLERDEQVVTDRLNQVERLNLPQVFDFLPSGRRKGRKCFFTKEDCVVLRREGVAVDHGDVFVTAPPPLQHSTMGISNVNNALAENRTTILHNQTTSVLEEEATQWGFTGAVCKRRSQGLGKLHASLPHLSPSSISQLSHLDLFLTFYFTNYVKTTVIPQTNLYLKLGDMDFSEFLVFLGLWLLMSCHPGNDGEKEEEEEVAKMSSSREEWWALRKPSVFEGGAAPFRFHSFMSLERFCDILSSLTYISSEEEEEGGGEEGDYIKQVRKMQEEWNDNMSKQFLPSWMSVLDVSVVEWHDLETCPHWMVFGEKSGEVFGNKWFSVGCGESKIVWRVELEEGFEEKGEEEQMGRLERMVKPIWYTGRVVQMNSSSGGGDSVAKGLLSLLDKGVFGAAALNQKIQDSPPTTGAVPENVINAHFRDKKVADVDVLQRETNGKTWQIFCMKEPDHIRKIMSTFGTMEEEEGADTRRRYIDQTDDGRGETKTVEFRYREPFANYFKYRNAVQEHAMMRSSPFGIEKTWKTNYWPDRNFAYFLAMTEVNTYLARRYFGCDDNNENKEEMTQLEFRKALAQEMIYNNLSSPLNNNHQEEGKDGIHTLTNEKNRRVRPKKDVQHELVTAPPYTGRWLANKSEWHKVKSKYLQQSCAKHTSGCKRRVRTYCKCTMGLFFCAEHYAEHIVESDLSLGGVGVGGGGCC